MDGHILFWSFTQKPENDQSTMLNTVDSGLKLDLILVGHNAPITGLAACNYQAADAFVSGLIVVNT